MNIALIGSGGREHVLCQKIYESSLSKKIFCIPGNPGTSNIAENVNLEINNFTKLLKFLKNNKVSLVIVGPEGPLVKGLTDFLNDHNINTFGPSKFASKLEGSKSFMKTICKKNKIPTAKYKTCKNKKDVNIFLKENIFPIVVKADGLAAGKGVTICYNKKEVNRVTKEIFGGKFKTSKKLVIEEYLQGDELSYFLIVDKNSYKFFGSAQDHKKVGERDKGPNTGGMGAYSPAPILNKKLENKILKRIVDPTLKALKKMKKPYTGFLYVGLIIVKGNPYLIEYNVRMGDPECQVILPRLNSDFLKIIISSINNKLSKIKINWKNKKCMTIVLCSKGYPGKFKKLVPIKNLNKIKLKKNIFIFHAGTRFLGDKLFSNGGRILNVTSIGTSFNLVRKRILKTLKKLNWKFGFYRKDIGWKVI